MSYDYSSVSKLLDLPHPYRLQNRLLGLCEALLMAGGPGCDRTSRPIWLALLAVIGAPAARLG